MNLLSISKQFQKLFNSNGTEKDISSKFKEACEKCNIEMPKWDRVVGKPVEAAGKTIYPIIEIVTIGNRVQNFKGIEIFPIALVIEESGEKYAISLTGEEINSEELIEMVSKSKK